MSTEVKLPESLEAIRALCVGHVEWRVAQDDGAYCMSFDRENSRNPEQEANEWLAKHLADYPHRFMPYKVQRVVVQSQLQEEALALIVRLSDAESALKARDAEIESAKITALNQAHEIVWRFAKKQAKANDRGVVMFAADEIRAAIDQARAEGGEKA